MCNPFARGCPQPDGPEDRWADTGGAPHQPAVTTLIAKHTLAPCLVNQSPRSLSLRRSCWLVVSPARQTQHIALRSRIACTYSPTGGVTVVNRLSTMVCDAASRKNPCQ